MNDWVASLATESIEQPADLGSTPRFVSGLYLVEGWNSMNKWIKIKFWMKLCKSSFEYVGNSLYKSDNALEAGVRWILLARFPATPLPIQCIRKVLRHFLFFHILLHYSLILIFIQSFFPSSIYTQYLWDSVFYIIAITIYIWLNIIWCWLCEVQYLHLCTWASSWD